MIKGPLQIVDDNLSLAWAKAFLESIESGIDEISPLTITVKGFSENVQIEVQDIRNHLDITLENLGKFKSATTANTIFPESFWNRNLSADHLFKRYLEYLPSIKKMAPANKYGLYFQRLISYGPDARNQLKYIIDTYLQHNNHRHSALQATIFDPYKDQTNQKVRGFPCLQQIAFAPNHHTGELSIHGFYATQYLFERAYGNLLGLSRLGTFMAHELGLKFTTLHCTAATAKYGDVSRRRLAGLVNDLKRILTEINPE